MNALYESSSKLLEENKTGLHYVLLTCKKSRDPPRVKPNTFSLPPHPKWYIFFNCDILLILAWWKKDESKGNWLMDYISNAMRS